MPKLLYLVPARRMIVDQTTSTASLIDIIEDVTIERPAGAEPVNPRSVMPLTWTLVASLLASEEDIGKKFEIKPEVQQPDGNVLRFSGLSSFTMDRPRYRATMNIEAFPGGLPGACSIRLFIRQVKEGEVPGSDEGWRELGTYEVNVIHTVAAPDEPSSEERASE
jgi:hypothetical protein